MWSECAAGGFMMGVCRHHLSYSERIMSPGLRTINLFHEGLSRYL